MKNARVALLGFHGVPCSLGVGQLMHVAWMLVKMPGLVLSQCVMFIYDEELIGTFN